MGDFIKKSYIRYVYVLKDSSDDFDYILSDRRVYEYLADAKKALKTSGYQGVYRDKANSRCRVRESELVAWRRPQWAYDEETIVALIQKTGDFEKWFHILREWYRSALTTEQAISILKNSGQVCFDYECREETDGAEM